MRDYMVNELHLVPYNGGWSNGTVFFTDDQATFFYNAHIASTRKTLEAVKQDVVGEDEEHKHMTRIYDVGCQRRDQRNLLRADQRQKLDQMISALECKGDEQ